MASNDNQHTANEQGKFLSSAMFRFQAFHRDWLVNVKSEGGVAEEDLVAVLHDLRLAEASARVAIDGRMNALKEIA